MMYKISRQNCLKKPIRKILAHATDHNVNLIALTAMPMIFFANKLRRYVYSDRSIFFQSECFFFCYISFLELISKSLTFQARQSVCDPRKRLEGLE